MGVDNAAVAKAAKAPVVLVGKAAKGDAIDNYNLNAVFFEAKGVPVPPSRPPPHPLLSPR